MTAIKITPTKLTGKVKIPPSKSLAHRAIICAALAQGKSKIRNIQYSQDIKATIRALRALGTTIITYNNYIIVDGRTTFTKQNSSIDCVESGSTLRFMVPISIRKQNRVHFVGQGNLGKRPLATFYEIFEQQNIKYTYSKDVLDLVIEGVLQPGDFHIPGNISSQFISGLLFALPLLDGNSTITVTSPLESRGYIDLTLQMLELYGIVIAHDNYQTFNIVGNQKYQPQEYYVEADFSQAAFYLVAGAIGNDVTLLDLNLQSLQGDKQTLQILESMGATIMITEEGVTVKGENLHGITIDASQCPDVIPVISVACSVAKGESKIINAGRLRIKECDRIEATTSQLQVLGVNANQTTTTIEINGDTLLHGGKCKSYDDHRIAMMLAIAATVADGEVVIDNKECVKKSYPSFWDDYKRLGGNICECNMEE